MELTNLIYENNSFTKEENKKHAEIWYDYAMRNFSNEIMMSTEYSYVYDCMDYIDRYKAREYWAINKVVVPMNSVLNFGPICETEYDKVAILNFASYHNPGGKFLEGSKAQEEFLCHNSILYPVLKNFDQAFYALHKNTKNKGLYTNDGLYTPKILFPNWNKKVDVVTMAAPNRSVLKLNKNMFTDEDNHNALRSRIIALKYILEDQKVSIAILGAWGCGVFAQDPYEVASLMNEIFTNSWGSLKQVIFAVPGGKNYEAFNSTISNI